MRLASLLSREPHGSFTYLSSNGMNRVLTGKFHAASAAFLLGMLLNAPVSGSDNKEIEVRVQHDSGRIIIYVTFLVPVMPQQAWAVLTDFDNIASFVSGVQFSKVISRTGNNLHVSQRGVTKYGFLSYTFDSVGEINLSPFNKIHERMIRGSMREMEETTILSQAGDQTRVSYHADIVPSHWIPRFVGKFFIEEDARERFRQMRIEIIRRGRYISAPLN
jgi:carbon monoxide dehydrogenase subunit G